MLIIRNLNLISVQSWTYLLILGCHRFLFGVFFGEALYFHSLLSTPPW